MKTTDSCPPQQSRFPQNSKLGSSIIVKRRARHKLRLHPANDPMFSHETPLQHERTLGDEDNTDTYPDTNYLAAKPRCSTIEWSL